MFQQNVTLGPGSGSFTSHTMEILIMLLGAFLLGLWLGWIMWSRFRQEAERLRVESDSLRVSLEALRAEFDASKTRLAAYENDKNNLALSVASLSEDNSGLRDRIALLQSELDRVQERNRHLETEHGLSFTPDEAPEAPAEPADIPLEVTTPANEETVRPADAAGGVLFSVVDDEGLPPAGETETDLESAAPPEANEAPQDEDDDEAPLRGMRFAMPDDHFSDDAFLELSRSTVAPPTEIIEESVPVVLTAVSQDDLKIVEGIGPKIEELLFKNGIFTYSELAAAPVSRLKEILVEAGPRFAMHDPGTWSAQALLAANGEWENLKAYQDFLNAGKRPGK